jgi:2,3-bisphosphoglycerate-independent phosphoglycerate mutase
MGAGRVLFQDLVRINQSIKTGAFFSNPSLLSALKGAQRVSATEGEREIVGP